MYEDTTCSACGSINGFSDSFLGKLGLVEHHRCRWCAAQYFVDEIEDDFLTECEHMVDFLKLLPEPGTGRNNS